MPTPTAKSLTGILIAFEAALVELLGQFNAVHWTNAQQTLLTTFVGAVLALLGAVYAHLRRGTAQEPVAIAASFTAVVSSLLAVGVGFDWWELTADQTASLVSLVSTVLGLVTALIARSEVTARVR